MWREEYLNASLNVHGWLVSVSVSFTTTGNICFLTSCLRCLEAGCGWSDTGCTWANQNAGNVILFTLFIIDQL